MLLLIEELICAPDNLYVFISAFGVVVYQRPLL